MGKLRKIVHVTAEYALGCTVIASVIIKDFNFSALQLSMVIVWILSFEHLDRR